MNKAIGQRAINRATGSVDITAASRSTLLVARTGKENPDERILVQVKSNVGPTGKAVIFSVAGGEVTWISDDDKTADEVLGNVFGGTSGRPDVQMQAAKKSLLILLEKGPRAQQEVMEMMRNVGVGESTVKKAKAELEIKSIKHGASWFWSLPGDELEEELARLRGREGRM